MVVVNNAPSHPPPLPTTTPTIAIQRTAATDTKVVPAQPEEPPRPSIMSSTNNKKSNAESSTIAVRENRPDNDNKNRLANSGAKDEVPSPLSPPPSINNNGGDPSSPALSATKNPGGLFSSIFGSNRDVNNDNDVKNDGDEVVATKVDDESKSTKTSAKEIGKDRQQQQQQQPSSLSAMAVADQNRADSSPSSSKPMGLFSSLFGGNTEDATSTSSGDNDGDDIDKDDRKNAAESSIAVAADRAEESSTKRLFSAWIGKVGGGDSQATETATSSGNDDDAPSEVAVKAQQQQQSSTAADSSALIVDRARLSSEAEAEASPMGFFSAFFARGDNDKAEATSGEDGVDMAESKVQQQQEQQSSIEPNGRLANNNNIVERKKMSNAEVHVEPQNPLSLAMENNLLSKLATAVKAEEPDNNPVVVGTPTAKSIMRTSSSMAFVRSPGSTVAENPSSPATPATIAAADPQTIVGTMTPQPASGGGSDVAELGGERVPSNPNAVAAAAAILVGTVVGSGMVVANALQAVSDWIEAGNSTTPTNATETALSDDDDAGASRTFLQSTNPVATVASSSRSNELDGEEKDGATGLFGRLVGQPSWFRLMQNETLQEEDGVDTSRDAGLGATMLPSTGSAGATSNAAAGTKDLTPFPPKDPPKRTSLGNEVRESSDDGRETTMWSPGRSFGTMRGIAKTNDIIAPSPPNEPPRGSGLGNDVLDAAVFLSQSEGSPGTMKNKPSPPKEPPQWAGFDSGVRENNGVRQTTMLSSGGSSETTNASSTTEVGNVTSFSTATESPETTNTTVTRELAPSVAKEPSRQTSLGYEVLDSNDVGGANALLSAAELPQSTNATISKEITPSGPDAPSLQARLRNGVLDSNVDRVATTSQPSTLSNSMLSPPTPLPMGHGGNARNITLSMDTSKASGDSPSAGDDQKLKSNVTNSIETTDVADGTTSEALPKQKQRSMAENTNESSNPIFEAYGQLGNARNITLSMDTPTASGESPLAGDDQKLKSNVTNSIETTDVADGTTSEALPKQTQRSMAANTNESSNPVYEAYGQLGKFEP
jgi:hypothetical protein